MDVRSVPKSLAVILTMILLSSLLAAPSGSAHPSSLPAFHPSTLPLFQSSDHTVFLPLVQRNYPTSLIPLYRLTASPADLAWLADNFLTDDTIPAVFTFEGDNHAVDIRYRGDTSRYFPKKSWKVVFAATDRFGPDIGQRRLNLNAEYSDKSLLREYLAYDFMNRVGVLAPRAEFVRLEISGQHMGLFVQIEQVDPLFLHRNGFDVQGNLYEANYGNLDKLSSAWVYRYYYDKKTNTHDGDAYHDLHAFTSLISETLAADFPKAIASAMDVDGWLDWYAATILLGDFEFIEKDYYFYHDFHTDRWHLIPWDFDQTFGHNWEGSLDENISWDNPIDSGTQNSQKYDDKWNVLVDRMMAVPEFRWHHGRRLIELMADEFSEAEMFPRIDAAHAAIRDAGLADPYKWGSNADFLAGPAELKTYVSNRRAYLSSAVGAFMPALPVPLVINEFMASNSNTLADEAGDFDDWIEIHNTSLASLDMSGMYLTDDLSQPFKWQVPEGTVIPGGGFVLIWADNEPGEGPLHANFTLKADGEAVALFDKDLFGRAQIDALTFGAQTTDHSYGRTTDGGASWAALSAPTPGWSNRGRPPIISDVTHTPPEPEATQPVAVTAHLTDDGTVVSAMLYYDAGVVTSEVSILEEGETGPAIELSYQATASAVGIAMYDDGAHGDGAPGDGIYGATLPALPHGTRVDYTITATDNAGMITTARPGQPHLAYVDPEIAPVVRYAYQVGYHRSPLYINEFLALNRDGLKDEAGNEDDWIELYNAGSTDLNIGGMHLSDSLRWPSWWVVPEGTVVPAHGYAIIWVDEEPDEGPLHASFALSGEGERVTLFDSHTRNFGFIDAVYFGPQQPDVSYGRHPDGGPAWGLMPPTPGGANQLMPPTITAVSHSPAYPAADQTVTVETTVTDDGAVAAVSLRYDTGSGEQATPMIGQGEGVYTAHIPARPGGTWVSYYIVATDDAGLTATHPPDAPATLHRYLVGYVPPTVVINEFLADNESVNQDEAGEFEDWIEFYNTGSAPLDVGGMYLTDDLTDPTQWRIPAGTIIPAHGHLLIWCDKEGDGPLHADFKLDKSGEAIGLFATDAWGNLLVDSLTFDAQATDVSLGRVPDGGERWLPLNPPTPGAGN